MTLDKIQEMINQQFIKHMRTVNEMFGQLPDPASKQQEGVNPVGQSVQQPMGP